MSKIIIILILLLLIVKVNQWSENHKLKELFVVIHETENIPTQQAYFYSTINRADVMTISSRKIYEVSH